MENCRAKCDDFGVFEVSYSIFLEKTLSAYPDTFKKAQNMVENHGEK